VVDVESGKVRRLTSGEFSIFSFSWSPDSASIALPVVDQGVGQVKVIQADGSGARTVADAVAGFWSP
jgi:hypothetical protein